MQVLVTGGAGRIGKFLNEQLRNDHRMIVLDMVPPEDRGLEYRKGDVRDWEAVKAAVHGVDAVVHLAAVPRDTGEVGKIMDINVKGTLNVLEAAAQERVRKVVLASSIATIVYFRWAPPYVWDRPFQPFSPKYFPVDEDHPCYPIDTYGTSKLVAEQLGRAYASKYSLSVTALRLATVWFPEDDPRYSMARLTRGIEHPEEAMDRIWAYVDVRDACQAIRKSLELNHEGFEVFNIGAGDIIGEFSALDLIARYYPDVPMIKKPACFVNRPNTPLFDISKAQRALGYRPQHSWREYTNESKTVEPSSTA